MRFALQFFLLMKYIAATAGALLGAVFIMSGVVVLFQLAPIPEIPKDSPPGQFMAAMAPTGYLTFIKVLEILGGLLAAIPRTRNLGLLVLGPIIVNILAFHLFITAGEGLFSPMVIGISVAAAFLLWVERRAFAALIYR